MDFVNDSIAGMEKEGIALNDLRLRLILRQAFGSPASLLDTLQDMTSEEFHTKYPDPVGELITWYIESHVGDAEF